MKGEVCTICGKEVKDFGGHYVPVVEQLNPYSDNSPVETKYEYHCFECDPITDLPEEVCHICGKKTSRAAGHVITLQAVDEISENAPVPMVYLWACNECDPVVIPPDQPEPDYTSGG